MSKVYFDLSSQAGDTVVTVGVGPGVDVTSTCDVEKLGVAVVPVGKILVEGKLWERAGVAVVMGTNVDDGAGV